MTEQNLITALNDTEAERIRWMTAALTVGNEIAALKAQVNYLREAALDAISFMVGGEAKAKLRDAYDATPEQCLAEVKAKAIEEIVAEFNKKGLLGTSLINLISDCVTQLREQAK